MLLNAKLGDYQLQRVKSVLEYADQKVPYYRRNFREHSISPHAINTGADLQSVPLLNKSIIQSSPSEFLSEDFRVENLYPAYTSGSTGQPLTCFMTPQERIVAGMHLMRARMKWGLTLPARRLHLGGAMQFISDDTNKGRRRQFGNLDILMLNVFEDWSDSVINNFLDELQAYQPHWIYGSPSIASRLATFILEHGRSIKLSNLKLIEMAGEHLSDEQRQLIFNAFQMRPVSQYACQELWGIAFECQRNQMHLLADHAYVEIIRQDGSWVNPGEIGEVIVTSLNKRAQPFIRYRLGDLAKFAVDLCDCGDPSPIINLVGGRLSERIFGTNNMIGSLLFDSIVKSMFHEGFSVISQYRVIQRTETNFDVWLVKSRYWEDENQLDFERKARKILGDRTNLHFHFVNDIPQLASGKSRTFIVDLCS